MGRREKRHKVRSYDNNRRQQMLHECFDVVFDLNGMENHQNDEMETGKEKWSRHLNCHITRVCALLFLGTFP